MGKTAWAVYLSVVVNLVTAAALDYERSDASWRAWLVTHGTVNELLGLLLIASPELVPRGLRLRSAAAQRIQELPRVTADLIRRMLGHARQIRVVDAGVTRVGASVSAGYRIKEDPPAGTVAERIAWLVARLAQQQERLDDMRAEVAALPARWRSDDQAVRDGFEGQLRAWSTACRTLSSS